MTLELESRRGIRFQARLVEVGSWTVLVLPHSASAKLPSRGMVMVGGTMNGFHFKSPLEPDGKRGHWLRVDKRMLEGASAKQGEVVSLEIEVLQKWPEPTLPEDLKRALKKSERAYETWRDATPAARWDWIRWIRSTKSPETRVKRIEVALSKLEAGSRRPCCFNRNMCTETEVSHNGVLMGSGSAKASG